jgi:hypothetical protein
MRVAEAQRLIYSPLDTPKGLRRGSVFRGLRRRGMPMPAERSMKCAITFFDGQSPLCAAKRLPSVTLVVGGGKGDQP